MSLSKTLTAGVRCLSAAITVFFSGLAISQEGACSCEICLPWTQNPDVPCKEFKFYYGCLGSSSSCNVACASEGENPIWRQGHAALPIRPR
jgi:hypothetical protein